MSQLDPSSLSYRAASRRVFLAALNRPCWTHYAPSGQPCWAIPGALTPTDVLAVCGGRVALTKKGPR